MNLTRSFGQQLSWVTLGRYVPAVERAAAFKVTRWPAASTVTCVKRVVTAAGEPVRSSLIAYVSRTSRNERAPEAKQSPPPIDPKAVGSI